VGGVMKICLNSGSFVLLKLIGAYGLLIAQVAYGQTTVALDYDIVYVRAPRLGDQTDMPMPEVFNAVQGAPGTDLVLRRRMVKKRCCLPAIMAR
jgi:hypothetical protein